MPDTIPPTSPTPTRAAELFSAYTPSSDVYDEIFSAPGQVRPPLARAVRLMEHISPTEWDRRNRSIHQLLHENDVTYNIFSDPHEGQRPWKLDLLPHLVAPDEWQTLEKGLIQRAVLLNHILVDLYGARHLIRRRQLPAELVHANPSFLPACHGWRVPQDIFLHFLAVDLARGADGNWRVISDSTQSVSGVGYALENRMVLSRVSADIFRRIRVQRLASFFEAFRAMLFKVSRAKSEKIRIVLMTPGPHDRNYFEHAFLARYLGCTLVESRDLTVRDNRVYLKTVAGLQPVEVIIRKADDILCDPLELARQSSAGVPGLIQAARSRNVVVINALGSGLVESKAFVPYLPSLSRLVLGEELKIPSIPTGWCGDPDTLKRALEQPDQFVIRPAFGRNTGTFQPVTQLPPPIRQSLLERLKSHPHLYCAQEPMRFSNGPVWRNSRIINRPISLRVFLVATDDTYTVMPGGLTSVMPADQYPCSFGRGEKGSDTKDTWVLSDTPVSTAAPLPFPGLEVEVRHREKDMPSRVADGLFWLGRYLERTENHTRLLRSALSRVNYETGSQELLELTHLVRIMNGLGVTLPESAATSLEESLPSLEPDLLSLVFDPQIPHGLQSALSGLCFNARSVRDRFSADTWRIINRLEDSLARPGRPTPPLEQMEDPVSHLNRLMLHLVAFSGMEMDNMTQGNGWLFLEMGRRIERSLYLAGILRSGLVIPGKDESIMLKVILELADSFMSYRSRYFTFLQLMPTLDLLITDETNPRSLSYQANALHRYYRRLPATRPDPLPDPAEKILIASLASLKLIDYDAIKTPGPSGRREALDTLLESFVREMPRLSDLISLAYFTHTRTLHTL